MSQYLKAQDFTNGKDGEMQFVPEDGKVIQVLGASKFSASTTPKVASRGQIGTRSIQSKITSFENKLSLTADYYLIGTIRSWLISQKETGKWPKIDMMAINYDKGTSLGRMSTLYKDLVPTDEIPLQLLDESSEEGLTLELNFTFSDWESISEFKDPTGYGGDSEKETKEGEK